MATEFNDDEHYGLFFEGGALTSSTSFKVRQSELTLAAMRAAGLLDNMVDGTTPPATDKFWLDKNTDPATLKEWDSIGSVWAPFTFERIFERAAVSPLVVTGGTGNAIIVSEPSILVPNRLYSITPVASNTDATTIQVVGVGTFDVRYLDGTAVSANEFNVGRSKVLLFRNGRFEVLFATSYLFESLEAAEAAATAAAAAAADAIAAAAAAAAIAGTLPVFSDAAALAAATVSNDVIIVGGTIYQENVNGTFSDFVGKKFAPAFFVTPRMFGAAGDGVADDRAAVQAAWSYAALAKIPCFMQGLEYNCSEAICWDSNLTVYGEGAIMYPTAWPASGGFINNVWMPPEPETRRIVDNVYISDLICDGSKLPHPNIPTISSVSAKNWLASNIAFEAASWVKIGLSSVLPNVAVAPDGTSTVDKIVEDTSTGSHVVAQTSVQVAVNGADHSFAVVLKAGERTKAQITLNGAGFSSVIASVTVDLVAGTVFATAGTIKTADVRAMGNGYYHVLITRTATANGTVQGAVYMADNAGSRSYTGNGASGLFVWNAFLYATEANNTNLFGGARGIFNARFVRCIGRKMREGSGGGTGGGAFGVEVGATNVVYEDCVAEDCFRAIRVGGQSGDWGSPTFATKQAIGIVMRNFTARRCGCAVFAHAVGSPTADRNVSDLSIFDVVISGITAINCGSYPWREFDYVANPTIAPQKQGVFVFAYGRNIYIEKARVRIDATWTTTDADWLGRVGYPGVGTSYIGAGLSGNVGSLIQGHGRNIVIRDVTLDGNVDKIFTCERAITFGDLATVPPTNGTGSVEQVLYEDIRHVRGTHNYVFDGQASLDNSKMSVQIRGLLRAAAPVTGVIGPNGTAALTNVRIQDVRASGVKIEGTAVEFLANGNAFVGTGVGDDVSYGPKAFGGGYSGTGARYGTSYDPTTNVWRFSSPSAASQARLAFYTGGGLVGSIATTDTNTAYNTTSDETRKDFIGEYSGQTAVDIIKADPVREFTWKEGGAYAVGWGAQTSYRVAPDLATPGGWFDPLTGQAVEEGYVRWINPVTHESVDENWVGYENRHYYDLHEELEATTNDWQGEPEGLQAALDAIRAQIDEIEAAEPLISAQRIEAIYVPWGIDQAKRTPYLWAAVSHLIDEVKSLKDKLEGKT